MKLTQLHDGSVYRSETPEQMVMYLWKGAFILESGPHLYMRAVSARAGIDSGAVIRTDTPTHFLIDLEEAGYVTIEWEESE